MIFAKPFVSLTFPYWKFKKFLLYDTQLTMQKILLAEDDLDLGSVFQQFLEFNDFDVTWAKDGEEAWKSFQKQKFDICILDVMMPKMDGFTLAKKIKGINSKLPFLFLTAKKLKEDRMEGLKLGADDYIVKPFEADELVLRIQNILKRVSPEQSKEPIQIGQIQFDFEELTLTTPTKTHQLTEKEGILLNFLFQNRNQLIRRESILIEVWGENDYFLGRSMDVFISRLRKYFQEDESVKIETVRGVGFRFLA
jgi:DNA-binding response OmpR family regulator